MTDRTTRVLLAVIALAVAGLLVRSFVAPTATFAGGNDTQVTLISGGPADATPYVLITRGGRMHLYWMTDQELSLIGSAPTSAVGASTIRFPVAGK